MHTLPIFPGNKSHLTYGSINASRKLDNGPDKEPDNKRRIKWDKERKYERNKERDNKRRIKWNKEQDNKQAKDLNNEPDNKQNIERDNEQKQ